MIQIRYIVALSILLITPLLLFTQTPSKLGLELRNIAQKNWKEPRMVSLFVEGDTSGIKRAVKTANGHFKYTYGNISSVTVPASQLMDFSRNPAIENIENAEREMQPLADEAIRNNNILPVQQGQTPLEQEYKGKDEVLTFPILILKMPAGIPASNISGTKINRVPIVPNLTIMVLNGQSNKSIMAIVITTSPRTNSGTVQMSQE